MRERRVNQILRVIGDVHGKIFNYKDIIRRRPFPSIQLGDMGFKKNYERLNKSVDPEQHRFIPGNHDEYPCLPRHALHRPYDYMTLGGVSFFYVRGANSTDKQYRIRGVSWWEEEEITQRQADKALEVYLKRKPELMLTHDCPWSIIPLLFKYRGIKSRTGQLLDAMLTKHKPKKWIFGHHHINKKKIIRDTEFICLGELQYIDIKGVDDGR